MKKFALMTFILASLSARAAENPPDVQWELVQWQQKITSFGKTCFETTADETKAFVAPWTNSKDVPVEYQLQYAKKLVREAFGDANEDVLKTTFGPSVAEFDSITSKECVIQSRELLSNFIVSGYGATDGNTEAQAYVMQRRIGDFVRTMVLTLKRSN